MTGRLHLDICQMPKCIVSGVEAKLRLLRSSSEFNLMGDENFKTVIMDATFNVRRVKPFPLISLSHAKLMNDGHVAKYPIRRNIIKTFSISKDDHQFNVENLFLGQVPDAMTVAILKSTSYHGSIGKNPFNYQNAKLKHLTVSVDGQSMPAKPLTLDFDNGQYSEAFYNLFQYTSKSLRDAGNNITMSDFRTGYSIFQFDLSPDTSA
jgi:hypothetical protein